MWWRAVEPSEVDFLVGDGAVYELEADDKRAAFAQLVEHLIECGRLDANLATVAVDALLAREALGSTAIGNGVAIPHARLDALRDLVGIVANVGGKIEFDSPDREPVTQLILLLAPKNDPGRYLRALERIARLLRKPS